MFRRISRFLNPTQEIYMAVVGTENIVEKAEEVVRIELETR